MKLGIVIYSDHSETVWNACRLANFSLSKGDQVKVFLMAKGVESLSLSTNLYNIKELLEKFRKIENEKSNPSIKKFFQKAKSFWNS